MIKIRLSGEVIFTKDQPVPVYWNNDMSCLIGSALLKVEPNGVFAEIYLDDIFPEEVMGEAQYEGHWSMVTDKGIFCCTNVDDKCGSSNFVLGLSLSREVLEI